MTDPPVVDWEKVVPLGPEPETVKLAAFMSIAGTRVLVLMLLAMEMESEPCSEEEESGLLHEANSRANATAETAETMNNLVFMDIPRIIPVTEPPELS